MPFEPRIAGSDDGRFDDGPFDDGPDLALPRELAALGDRLGREAESLAERYPAAAAEKGMPAAVSVQDSADAHLAKTRRWRVVVAVASSLAVAVSLAVAAWLAPAGRPVATQVEPAGPLSDGGRGASGHAAASSRPAAAAERPTGGAIFLEHVSSPELEGLLDLLEHDSHDGPKLSI
jgi:hypothetical protein